MAEHAMPALKASFYPMDRSGRRVQLGSGMSTEATLAGGVQQQHLAALDQGRFLIQHCAGCGKHVYFPRAMCPHCGAGEPALVPPAGTGTVAAVTTIGRKPDRGGDYNVCLVDLDEGVRLMSRVDGLAPDRGAHRPAGACPRAGQHGKGLVVFDRGG
jgi:uncharacterized OB-fold protein